MAKKRFNLYKWICLVSLVFSWVDYSILVFAVVFNIIALQDMVVEALGLCRSIRLWARAGSLSAIFASWISFRSGYFTPEASMRFPEYICFSLMAVLISTLVMAISLPDKDA